MSPEELNKYTSEKVHTLLSTTTGGAKVFEEINSNPNLTPQEKQRVCCAIGKAVTQVECSNALKSGNVNTVMRGNGPAAQFLSAYMGHHASAYTKSVTDKSVELSTLKVENEGGEMVPDRQGMAKGMMKAYTSELPKLSKEATQFMKSIVDVIEEEMPQHAPKVTPLLMSSTLVLRAAAPKVSTGLRTTYKDSVKAQGDHETEMRDAGNEIVDANKSITASRKKIEENPTDEGLKLREGENIKEQEKIIEAAKNKQELSKQKVKPFEGSIAEEQAATEGILAVMEVSNKLTDVNEVIQGDKEGMDQVLKRESAIELAGSGEHVTEFSESLKSVGDGSLGQYEEIDDLPSVDVPAIQDQIKKEQAALKQTQDKQKVQPDLDKLAALQTRMDKLNQPKPPLGERFKAFFTKGGIDALKEKVAAEIEKTKLDIVSKVDSSQLEKRVEANEQQLEKAIDQGRGLNRAQEVAEYGQKKMPKVEGEKVKSVREVRNEEQHHGKKSEVTPELQTSQKMKFK